jgi:hypothetical protein
MLERLTRDKLYSLFGRFVSDKEKKSYDIDTLVYISWGLTDSIQAHFYPIEVTSKGVIPTEYGLVMVTMIFSLFRLEKFRTVSFK